VVFSNSSLNLRVFLVCCLGKIFTTAFRSLPLQEGGRSEKGTKREMGGVRTIGIHKQREKRGRETSCVWGPRTEFIV